MVYYERDQFVALVLIFSWVPLTTIIQPCGWRNYTLTRVHLNVHTNKPQDAVPKGFVLFGVTYKEDEVLPKVPMGTVETKFMH